MACKVRVWQVHSLKENQVATKTNGSKLQTITVGKQKAPQIGGFNLPTDEPWGAEFTIKGISSMIFHRFNAEEGDGPAGRKGTNKTDNPEDYVYRCEDNSIGLPAEYVRQAMIGAAKYRKDPRSPRASAMGLFKAAVILTPEIASLGCDDWDYLDRRGAVIQRSRIKRVRPAFEAGWEATFRSEVLLPEYVTPALLMDVLADAGRLVGLGEMRPAFGRFAVVRFEVIAE